MLSKEEFFVLRHYLGEGVSKTAIAKKLGVSRMTVYRHAASDSVRGGGSIISVYTDCIGWRG